MKFKQHLKEEYIARVKNFEIFKNPTQSEISKLLQMTKGKIRVLLDDTGKRNWWIFSYQLLHKYAIEQLIEEDLVDEGNKFRSSEIYIKENRINLFFYYGSYIVEKGKVIFKSTNYNDKDYIWIAKHLRFLNRDIILDDVILNEEYFGRGMTSGARDDTKFEVFKNPSMKEFRECEKASKAKGRAYGFVRLLLNRDDKNLFIAPGDALHDEIAKVIDKEEDSNYEPRYERYYYPLVGYIEGNVLHLESSSIVRFNENEIKTIMDIMEKKTYFEVKWSGK